MRTHRFGRKIKLPATIVIKHQLRKLTFEDAVKTAENLLRQNLPPRHNLSDAVIILRLRELVGSPAMRSALERGSDNGVRTLPLADLPQPLRGLCVLCFGARRPLLLVKEVYPAHIRNVWRSGKPHKGFRALRGAA